MFEQVVHKVMMGLTPEDVGVAIDAGCAKEMENLVEAMGWLAFRWWSSPGEKNEKNIKEIQDRLAKLQLKLNPRS